MTRLTIVVLAGLVAAAAPAGAQNREHLQMAAELQILRQQNQELTNLVVQLTRSLDETAKRLNTRIDETIEAMRTGFANQSVTLNTTGGEVRRTLAQTQDIATRVGELKEEVEALRSALPSILSRLTPVDPAVAVDPSLVSDAGTPPPAVQTPPSTLGLSPERMYNTAFADYGSGNYAAAIRGFQEFLATFATSNRADDAQFYIGEAEYQQNRFEAAIAAYNLVIQNYPTSEHLSWAYYRRGLAQDRIQRTADAQASFETVVKQYPNSEAAIMAEAGLQRLKTRPAPAAPR